MTKKTVKDLQKLTQTLRSNLGCPWDRSQTITSLLKCMEDEVLEVKQAVENADHANLKEELGDVLFQILMISQIAKEKKYFTFDDVVENIHKKIVSRHTWVFGKDKAKTPEEAVAMWKKNKIKEKEEK